MKRSLGLLVALALTGCGNWSVEDLNYLSALPTKDTLASQLKGSDAQMLRGASTKQQGLFEDHPLNVGDMSSAYGSTRDTAKGFNTIIEFVTDVVAFVERIPPNKRTSNTRVWGPYPDDKHPGNEWRLTVTKLTGTHYSYAFDCHKSGVAFVTAISGEAEVGQTAHHGVGSIDLNFKSAADSCAGDSGTVDSAHIDYDTTKFPTAVEAKAFAAQDAGSFTVDYSMGKDGDATGKLSFSMDPTTPVLDGGVAEIQASSYWLADGSGKQVGQVTKGSLMGVNGIECWDSSQAVTYQKWWDGTEHGDPMKCPAPPF